MKQPHPGVTIMLLTTILAAAALAAAAPPAPSEKPRPSTGETGATLIERPLTIVIHGGAGALAPGKYTPDEEAAYKATLMAALEAGYAVLEQKGSALDAVEAAIVVMEDSPLFNAGKGAVFTYEGGNELDASIMEGKEKKAGAVAGVTRVKNPIRLARAVMEKSEHVMMARDGAEAFAKSVGVERVDPKYFRTERRWDDYVRKREEMKAKKAQSRPDKYGTVGAVALDAEGNLAAGTSTGGMLMKRYGRIGDAPVIGAGTYADNKSCAVSATGWGEYFIRLAVAHEICAQVAHAGKTVGEAADAVIMGELERAGGDGGVIVLDAKGDFAMTFNSEGMFRGVKQGESASVAIYRE
jgi:beta-aspartyl-peptidase (threonine type)